MELNLHELMDNMSINEVSYRDQEYNENDYSKMYHNTNLVNNFFKRFHNVNEINSFIDTNISVLKTYLTCKIFNFNYINVTPKFTEDINNFRQGIIFFISNFNKDNIDYNIQFIKIFNQNLQDFLYYNRYDTGILN